MEFQNEMLRAWSVNNSSFPETKQKKEEKKETNKDSCSARKNRKMIDTYYSAAEGLGPDPRALQRLSSTALCLLVN